MIASVPHHRLWSIHRHLGSRKSWATRTFHARGHAWATTRLYEATRAASAAWPCLSIGRAAPRRRRALRQEANGAPLFLARIVFRDGGVVTLWWRREPCFFPKNLMSGAFKRDLPPTPKFGLLLPELRRMRSHFHAAEAISSPMLLFTLGPMRIAFLCQRIQIEMVVPGM